MPLSLMISPISLVLDIQNLIYPVRPFVSPVRALLYWDSGEFIWQRMSAKI